MFITKTGPQPVRTGQDQVLVLGLVWTSPRTAVLDGPGLLWSWSWSLQKMVVQSWSWSLVLPKKAKRPDRTGPANTNDMLMEHSDIDEADDGDKDLFGDEDDDVYIMPLNG